MQRRLLALALFTATARTAVGLAGAPAAYAAGDPVSMTNGFYVNPGNSAAQWAAANPGDGRAAAIESGIAGEPAAEVLRWIKTPGESDGDCGTSTSPAGQFDPQLAYDLVYGC